MTQFFLIILLSYLQLASHDRLPTFPTMTQNFFPKQDLTYSKVKKIVFLSSSFSEDGPNTKMKFDFYYDNKRLKTERFLNYRNDSAYNTITFDKFSRIIRQINASSNSNEEIIYTYNEKENKSTETQLSKNYSTIKKTEIYYNKQYQPYKKLEFNGDTSLACYWTYKYNKFGDLIEECFINKPNGHGNILDSSITGGSDKFYPSPNDTTRYSISYDTLNRPLTKIKFTNSKKKSKTEYLYSSDSSKIKTTTYFNYKNNLYPRSIHLTTAHDSVKIVQDLNLNIPDSTIVDSELKFLYVNNVIKETFQRGSSYNLKNTIRIETLYDSHDNWIKKTSYSNQRINGILERTITY
jgi:hypothetical protein